MGKKRYTDGEGKPQDLPPTHWSWIIAVQDGEAPARQAALEQLISLYWEPVRCWFVRYGFPNEEAKDLAQEFFIKGLREKGPFHRAKQRAGGFRPYLRACLRNFAHNRVRTQLPKMLSLDIKDTDGVGIGVFDTETPEDTFNRAFARELLLRVMKTVEQKCRDTGREALYELFRKRVVEPSLNGAVKPKMMEFLHGLRIQDEKQGANRLVTLQRLFRRALIAEIRGYAGSDEEVACELRDLFDVVQRHRRLRQ